MDSLFYEPALPALAGAIHSLSPDTVRHALQVLRKKEGDSLWITNGLGALAETELVSVQKKAAAVRLLSLEMPADPAPPLHIAIGMIKNPGRLEWMLEKLTELGVTRISLLYTRFTEKSHLKAERWNQILVSAMLQSQQYRLPVLNMPVSLEQAMAAMENVPQKFIAHCAQGPKGALHQVSLSPLETAVLIGPEGDFSAGEITQAVQKGFRPIRLGPTRLRTETAAICAAALVLTR